MASIMTYGLFPVHFFGGLAVALYAVRESDALPIWLAMISAVTALIVAILERVHPRHRSWNRSKNDVKTDMVHTVISMIALPPILETALLASIVAAVGYFSGGEHHGFWPHNWPMLAQLGLALVVSQFFEYWFHRWSHERDILWRLHATHHSPKRLYWLNASRFHPLDTAGGLILGMGSLMVLGASEPVFFLLTVWIAIHGMYQHCNIDVRLGPLNYIFSMAELHRWHHAVNPDEANHNYGNNIILWDLVFGTFFWPKDREPPEMIGLDGLDSFPEDYLGQLLSPFQWRRLNEQPLQKTVEPIE